MKIKLSYIFLFLISFSGWTSCIHDNALIDTNMEILKHNWPYINKIKVPFVIDDINSKYNLSINLRHTSDYKYSNIFLLVTIVDSQGKRTTERKEFKLANPDGEWLGSGSGNLYSYQLSFKSNMRFAKSGKYIFEIEQNMRDNPLKEISDVGLRVEIAK